MTSLGVKTLTVDNWLEPDPVNAIFSRLSLVDGEFHPITGEDRLRDILAPQLTEMVPVDIRALLEVARSALAYGYFCYPLFTLGEEQLFRVAEAAITNKCRALGAPSSVGSYKERVDWLAARGVLTAQEQTSWHAARQLRNAASHPEGQAIGLPNQAVSTLWHVVNDINHLFADVPLTDSVLTGQPEGE